MQINPKYTIFPLLFSFLIIILTGCNPAVVQIPQKNITVNDSTVADSTKTAADSLYFKEIPAQITDEFHEFPLFDLKKYLVSTQPADSLKWKVRSAKNLNVFIDEKKRVLALRRKPNWSGTEIVNFVVKNRHQDSVAVSVNYTVNSLPVLADIPDQTIGKGMKFDKIKLNLYLKDKNDKPGTFRWEITGTEKVKIDLDSKNQATITLLDSGWTGADTVFFKAYDPYGVYAGDAVVFKVDPNYSIYSIQPNLYLRSAGSLKKMPTGEQYLLNNVHIDYKEYGVKCDTAIVNQNRTETRLFGNVVIWDTLRTVTSKRAEIYREKEKNRIFLYDDVKIDQDSIRLFAKNATFQQQFNNARLEENARVEYTPYPAILHSRHLLYDMNTHDLQATMVESVIAVDSLNRYQLTTATVSYNDSTQLLKIPGQFTLKTKKLAAEIKNFTHQKESDFNSLFAVPEINAPDGTTLAALQGEYSLKDQKAWLWNKIKTVAVENYGIDTTLLFADTAFYDLAARRLDLFGNVKIIRDTLTATAGLAVFYQDERRLKLYKKPEMFLGQSYVRGDSVEVFFKQDSVSRYPEKAVIQGAGFMETPAKTALPSEKNNLRGQQIELYFADNKLNRVRAAGQVTSLFYNRDQQQQTNQDSLTVQPLKEAEGANQVTGDTLEINLQDNKVRTIHFQGGCEGTYYPKKFKKLIKK